jgi:hypothetical protein
MECSIITMVGMGVALVVVFVIGLLLDVDQFAGGFFSRLTKGKDPHRKD